MCLGIAGQVVELDGEHPDLAVVDVSGARRTVNIGLLEGEGVGPGDWVLIHVGFAMSKLDEAEAVSSMALLEEMGQAFRDGVAAAGGGAVEPGSGDVA